MRLRAILAVAVLVTGLGTTAHAEAEVQPATAPVVASGAESFQFADPEIVATGLDVPWGLDFLPDGSALVAQRDQGSVVRVRPGRPPVQVARIPGVVAGGEGGLLGLAVSPRYPRDRWVYVCFTTASDIRITRFRLSAPQTQQVILSGLTRASIHNGGRIAFGPDGLLYAGIGDAAVPANAQSLASRNGKILRIRPNGGIPADNPFPNSPIYSYGHRNVQGLAWDPRGRLFATEFGQATWDEVNVIVRGGNYGWPIVEGPSNDPRFRAPVVVWPPAQASPSGAAFANGTLFVAALRGARLWAVPVSAAGTVGTPSAELTGAYGRLRTVELAPDGSLWVTTSNRDDNGTPTPVDDRILRFTTGERQPPPAGRSGSHAADSAQP
ncbi:glucose sorbosone dehydrogenase [Micromonospora ureilytica]|uniref:Glucose sorbosone dehydrogenase n=1 Tax=Micromonospora ureilytica TaxID=709868 RepID=A0A3N9Y1B2_9ACTN|nr:PQQ-dependent sugar dehydrogenase [Micromonospora ureilytica]RQX19068.1 glucose sorbosone dehydrogenase [Micromonospora ureilytica]